MHAGATSHGPIILPFYVISANIGELIKEMTKDRILRTSKTVEGAEREEEKLIYIYIYIFLVVILYNK